MNDVYKKLGFFEENIQNYIPLYDSDHIDGTELLKTFVQRTGYNLDNSVVDIEALRRFYWLDENYSNAVRNNQFKNEVDGYRHWSEIADYALSDYYMYSFWEQQQYQKKTLDSKPFGNMFSQIRFEQNRKYNWLLSPDLFVYTGTITYTNQGTNVYGVYFLNGDKKSTEDYVKFEDIINFSDPEEIQVGSTVYIAIMPEDDSGNKGNVSTINIKRAASGFYIYIGFLYDVIFASYSDAGTDRADKVSEFLKQIANYYDSSTATQYAPWQARETLMAYSKTLDDKYYVVEKAVNSYQSYNPTDLIFRAENWLRKESEVSLLDKMDGTQNFFPPPPDGTNIPFLPPQPYIDKRIESYVGEYKESVINQGQIDSVYRYNNASEDVRLKILSLYYSATTDENERSTIESIQGNISQKIFRFTGEDLEAIQNEQIFVFPTLGFEAKYLGVPKTKEDCQSYDSALIKSLFGTSGTLRINGNVYDYALENNLLQRCFYTITNVSSAGVYQSVRHQGFVTDLKIDYYVNFTPYEFSYTAENEIYNLLVSTSRLGRDTCIDAPIPIEKMNSKTKVLCGVHNERHRYTAMNVLYAKQAVPNFYLGAPNRRISDGFDSYESAYKTDNEGNPLVEWVERYHYENDGMTYEFIVNDLTYTFTISQPYISTSQLVLLINEALNGSDTLLDNGIVCKNDGDVLYLLSKSEIELKRAESEAGYRFWENLGWSSGKVQSQKKQRNGYNAIEGTQEMTYPFDHSWSFIVDVGDESIVLTSEGTENYLKYGKDIEYLFGDQLKDLETPYTETILNEARQAFIADIQLKLDAAYNDDVDDDGDRINAYIVPGTNFTFGLESKNKEFSIRRYDLSKGYDYKQFWRDLFVDNTMSSTGDSEIYLVRELEFTDSDSTIASAVSAASDYSSDTLAKFKMLIGAKEFVLHIPKRWMLYSNGLVSEKISDISDISSETINLISYDASSVDNSTLLTFSDWDNICGIKSLGVGGYFDSHRNNKKHEISSYLYKFFAEMSSADMSDAYLGSSEKLYVVPKYAGSMYTMTDGKNLIASDLELTFVSVDGVALGATATTGQSITIPAGYWTVEELCQYINDMRLLIGGEQAFSQTAQEYADRKNIWKVTCKYTNVAPLYDTTNRYVLYFEQECENDSSDIKVSGTFAEAFGFAPDSTTIASGSYGSWSSNKAPILESKMTAKTFCDLLNWRADLEQDTDYDPLADWLQYETIGAGNFYKDANYIEFYAFNNKWVGIKKCSDSVTFDNTLTNGVYNTTSFVDLLFKFSDTESTTTFEPEYGLFYTIRDVLLRHQRSGFDSFNESDVYADDTAIDIQQGTERNILDGIYHQKVTPGTNKFRGIFGSPRITVKGWKDAAKYDVSKFDDAKYGAYYEDSLDLCLFELSEEAELTEEATLRQQRKDLVADQIRKHFKWSVNTTAIDALKQAIEFIQYYNGLYNRWRTHTFRLGDEWDTVSICVDGGMAEVNITEVESVWRQPPFIPYIAQLLGWDMGGESDFSRLSTGTFVKSLVKLYKIKGTTEGAEMLFNMIGIAPEIYELYRSFPLNGQFEIPNKDGIRKDLNCIYDTSPFTSVNIPEFYRSGTGRSILSNLLFELGYIENAYGDIPYDEITEKIKVIPSIQNYVKAFANNSAYRHPGKWYLNKSNRVRMRLNMVRWQTLNDTKMETIEKFVEFVKPVHIMFEDISLYMPAISEKPYDPIMGAGIKDALSLKMKTRLKEKMLKELVHFDSYRAYRSRRDHLNAADIQNRNDAPKYQEVRLNTCNSVICEPGSYTFSQLDDKRFRFILHNGRQYYFINKSIEDIGYYFRRIGIVLNGNNRLVVKKDDTLFFDIVDEGGSTTKVSYVENFEDRAYTISDLSVLLNEQADEMGVVKYWFSADESNEDLIVMSYERFRITDMFDATYSDTESYILGERPNKNIQLESGRYVNTDASDTLNVNYESRPNQYVEFTAGSVSAIMPYSETGLEIPEAVARIEANTIGSGIKIRQVVDESGAHIRPYPADKNVKIINDPTDASLLYECGWQSGYSWSPEILSSWLFAVVYKEITTGKYPEYHTLSAVDVRKDMFNCFETYIAERPSMRVMSNKWYLHFEMNDMFNYLDIQSYLSRPHHSFMIDNYYEDGAETPFYTLYASDLKITEIDPTNTTQYKSGLLEQQTESQASITSANGTSRRRVPYSQSRDARTRTLFPDRIDKAVARPSVGYSRLNSNWKHSRLDWIPYHYYFREKNAPYYNSAMIGGDINDGNEMSLTSLSPEIIVDTTCNKLYFDVRSKDTWEENIEVIIKSGTYTELEDIREAIQIGIDNAINRPRGYIGNDNERVRAITTYSRKAYSLSNTYITRFILHLQTNGTYMVLPGESVVIDIVIDPSGNNYTGKFEFTNNNAFPLNLSPNQLVDGLNNGYSGSSGSEGIATIVLRSTSDGYYIEIVATSLVSVVDYPTANPLTDCYMVKADISENGLVPVTQKNRYEILFTDTFDVAPGSSVGFSTSLGNILYDNDTVLIQKMTPRELVDKLLSVNNTVISLKYIEYGGDYYIDLMAGEAFTVTSYTSSSVTGSVLAESVVLDIEQNMYNGYILDRGISFESLDIALKLRNSGDLFKKVFRRFNRPVDVNWGTYVENGETYTYYNNIVQSVVMENPNLVRFDGFVYDDKYYFRIDGMLDAIKCQHNIEFNPLGWTISQNSYPNEDSYMYIEGEKVYQEKFMVIGLGTTDDSFIIPPAEGRTFVFDLFVKDGDANYVEVYNDTPLPMELSTKELAEAINTQLETAVKKPGGLINPYACGQIWCTANTFRAPDNTIVAEPAVILNSYVSFSIKNSECTFCNPSSVTGQFLAWLESDTETRWYPNGIPTFGGESRPYGSYSWSSVSDYALSDDSVWYFNDEDSARVGCRHELLLRLNDDGKIVVPPASGFAFTYAYDDGTNTAINQTGSFEWVNNEPTPAELEPSDVVDILNDPSNGLTNNTNMVATLENYGGSYKIVLNNGFETISASEYDTLSEEARKRYKIDSINVITYQKRKYQYFEMLSPVSNILSTDTGWVLNDVPYTYEDSEYNRIGYFKKPTYWRDYYNTLNDDFSIGFDYREFDPRFVVPSQNNYERATNSIYDKRQSINGRRAWDWKEKELNDIQGLSHEPQSCRIKKVSYYPENGFSLYYADNNDMRKPQLMDYHKIVGKGLVRRYSDGFDNIRVCMSQLQRMIFRPVLEDADGKRVIKILPNSSLRLAFKILCSKAQENRPDEVYDAYTISFIEISNTSATDNRYLTVDDLVLEMNISFGASYKNNTDENLAKTVYFWSPAAERRINYGALNKLRVAKITLPDIGECIAFVEFPLYGFEIVNGLSTILDNSRSSYLEFNPDIPLEHMPKELIGRRSMLDETHFGSVVLPVLRKVADSSSNYMTTERYNVSDLNGLIETQYLRWSAKGFRRGPYVLTGKSIKVCFYPRTIDSSNHVFSPSYVYTITFDRDFYNAEEVCEYINEKIYEVLGGDETDPDVAYDLAHVTSDQEKQALSAQTLPFVRATADGYIQTWCPCYYRFLYTDALDIIGFRAMEDSEVDAIEAERELWLLTDPDTRASIYGSEIYKYLAPRTYITTDRPTDLYIIKDSALISQHYSYVVQMFSEFFQPNCNTWWQNNIQTVPANRDRFVCFGATDPFICEFKDIDANIQ